MTEFILLCSFLFLVLGLMRLRYAFYTYIFLLPFMPPYIAIAIEVGGAGVSLRRILTYILLLLLVKSYLDSPKVWRQVTQSILKWRLFVAGLIGLYLIKLLSTLELNEPVAIAYWLDELAEVVVALLFAIRYLVSEKGLKLFFLVVSYSLLVCQVFVMVEYYTGHPLLQGLVSVDVSTAGTEVLDGFERGESYRAMGLFDNPLSLSEFALIGAVFSYGAYKLYGFKWIPVLAVILVPVTVVYTGSRSGVLMILVLLFVFFYRSAVMAGPAFKPIFQLVMALFVCMVMYFLYFAIVDPVGFIALTSIYLGGDETYYSTLSRLTQFEVVFSSILENSMFGYGLRNEFIQNLGISLDNYYLRLLIESGFVGLSLFLVSVASVFTLITRNYTSQAFKIFDGDLKKVFILYLVLFIGYKFFVSMSYNNIYFYFVSGILIGLICRYGKPTKHGSSR